jgi:hypothetical protein
MSRGKERAADPAPGVGGMDEKEEHLAVLGMNGRVADDAIRLVHSDEEHLRRLVVSHELLPVLGGEHRLGGEIAEVGPSRADGGVEDRSDGLSVPLDGASQLRGCRIRPDLVHEMPPSALGSRDRKSCRPTQAGRRSIRAIRVPGRSISAR